MLGTDMQFTDSKTGSLDRSHIREQAAALLQSVKAITITVHLKTSLLDKAEFLGQRFFQIMLVICQCSLKCV